MSTIGGPGGIGGPKGPSGPTGPDGPDDVAEAGEIHDASAAAPASASQLDAIAADLEAGKLTPHEAVDRLVDQIASEAELPASERAELRALIGDLIANDPHLGSLINRL